ncbi:MAG: flagellar export protein FliJ [Alphaproteobacteria bacterium]
MSELDSLIRVRRHDIEQKQKALGALYAQAEELKTERDTLEAGFAIESEKTKDMTAEMMQFFQPYADRVQDQIEQIDVAREQLEHKIRFAQDEMRDSFAEMKKIEIIDERRKAELLAEIDKKESEMLDEIALDAFRRKGG